MVGTRYRIMIVLTPAFVPTAGGVQMSTSKMARKFSASGHQVMIFSFAASGHELPVYAELVHSQEAGGSASAANLDQLVEVVERFRPDVVINQMPYEHSIGEALIANKTFLLLGCLRNSLFSVVGDLDGFIDRAFPGSVARILKNPVGRAAIRERHRRSHARDLRRILETYDYFVMFGPPNLEELRYFVPGFAEDSVRLVPNSIPEVVKVPPPKEKRLLWLGRVEYAQKRAELILEVWRRVCWVLTDWELDVVGEGTALSELKRKTLESGLPRIHFHGRQVPDDYYRRSPIFFMTSAFEGFPNTLVEAQSRAAIPVVFDSYPVASWIVEDGKSGFLVKPFNVDEMAQRIVDLANSTQREGFAELALASARRFHIDRVGQMWEKLFDAEVPRHVDRHEAETAA